MFVVLVDVKSKLIGGKEHLARRFVHNGNVLFVMTQYFSSFTSREVNVIVMSVMSVVAVLVDKNVVIADKLFEHYKGNRR